jgi:hypothetical protein
MLTTDDQLQGTEIEQWELVADQMHEVATIHLHQYLIATGGSGAVLVEALTDMTQQLLTLTNAWGIRFQPGRRVELERGRRERERERCKPCLRLRI